jgi:hypothetical protein
MAKSPARSRPLADLLEACLGPALQAQGFASADILVAWPDIVGARLAATCQPLRLEWRRRGQGFDRETKPEPATLIVRVESAFALEMQHLGPLILERVNTHYGWRCVGKLVLKQGQVRRVAARSARTPVLGDVERRRVDMAVAGVGDDGLKAALDRLGAAVIGSLNGGSSRTKP